MSSPLPPEPAIAAPPSPTAWVLAAVAAVAAAAWIGRPAHIPRLSTAVFDLERDLKKANLAIDKRGVSAPCVWQASDRRFRCGDEPWAFVGPYGGTTAGVSRRCTWAHPVAAGSSTLLRWPGAAVGGELSATLGLVDAAPDGPPVHLKIWLDQELVAELETRSSADLAAITKPLDAGNSQGELRLELSAADHALRMACVDVRMRGPRAPRLMGTEAR